MMRNNKKITIFTIVCIILLALSLNAFAATADTTAPVINSISINGNKDYKLGEKVYLNLDANDDISGINRIDISIQCLSVEDSQDPIVSTTSEIYDFNTSNPYFIIPSQLYSGSYTVDQIYIYDNNNNCRQYSNNENLWDQFEKLEYTLKFNIEAGGSDKVAPILNNISFDKTNMVYGEEITITANASDDMSGVRQIQVFLKNESIKDLISIFLEKDNTNKYIGKFKPYLNGTYELSHVLLDDNSYNDIVYYTDTFTGDVFENYKKIDKKSFNVTGGTDSFSDISIANMDFTYKQLSAPNIFKLRIKLNDNDQVVKQIQVYIGMEGKDYSSILYLNKDEEGYYTGHLDIDQFFANGKYEIKEIFLVTKYDQDDLSLSREISSKLEYNKKSLFEVVESKRVDVITSTTDKDIIEKINNANDGSNIVISSANDPVVKKEVFEAIKGTNKTISIESSGIIWVFEGKKITNPKDINVRTIVDFCYNSNSAGEYIIYLEKGISIVFANNGELPGVAKIRLKADYIFRDYLGLDSLFVYLYNGANEDSIFTVVGKEITLSEDGYYDFYIMHNSEYVISPDKLSEDITEEKIVTSEGYIENQDNLSGTISNETNEEKIQSTNNSKLIIAAAIMIVLIVLFILLVVSINKKK